MVKMTSRMVLRLSTTEARSLARSPYSCFMATENWEMAGEWLNANTSTGMIIHTDIRKSPGAGAPWKTLRSQLGIR